MAKRRARPKFQFFRACAGAVIVGRDGKVLLFERSDTSDAWQFPQGGVKEGEDPFDAVLREVEEETGIGEHDLELLHEHPVWLAYELPRERHGGRKGRGQVQRWYLFLLAGGESAIRLDRARSNEFSSWRWATMREAVVGVIWFKKPVYRELERSFAPFVA